MSTELINWLLGGGGILSIITVLINRIFEKKKNKLENTQKQISIENDVNRCIQDAYKLFVNDYKAKTGDLIGELEAQELKVNSLIKSIDTLSEKYKTLKNSYNILQSSYNRLESSYKRIENKYVTLKNECKKTEEGKNILCIIDDLED